MSSCRLTSALASGVPPQHDCLRTQAPPSQGHAATTSPTRHRPHHHCTSRHQSRLRVASVHRNLSGAQVPALQLPNDSDAESNLSLRSGHRGRDVVSNSPAPIETPPVENKKMQPKKVRLGTRMCVWLFACDGDCEAAAEMFKKPKVKVLHGVSTASFGRGRGRTCDVCGCGLPLLRVALISRRSLGCCFGCDKTQPKPRACRATARGVLHQMHAG